MKNKKATAVPTWKPGANPERAQAMHGLRSSNAATPHDTRPNRERTRMNVRNVAIKDSHNQ